MQTISKASLVLSAVLSAIGSVTAQADASTAATRVYGYQDTQTGTFHAARHAVTDATTTPTTGTVAVTFNVKLITSFAKGTPLNCSINLYAGEINKTTFLGTDFTETASVSVAIEGSTATCTATIPYSWVLPGTSTTEDETFTGDYTLIANPTPATGTISRLSLGTFVSTTLIPASGTTSKYTVNVTL